MGNMDVVLNTGQLMLLLALVSGICLAGVVYGGPLLTRDRLCDPHAPVREDPDVLLYQWRSVLNQRYDGAIEYRCRFY